MHEELFTLALNLQEPWNVKKIELIMTNGDRISSFFRGCRNSGNTLTLTDLLPYFCTTFTQPLPHGHQVVILPLPLLMAKYRAKLNPRYGIGVDPVLQCMNQGQ